MKINNHYIEDEIKETKKQKLKQEEEIKEQESARFFLSHGEKLTRLRVFALIALILFLYFDESIYTALGTGSALWFFSQIVFVIISAFISKRWIIVPIILSSKKHKQISRLIMVKNRNPSKFDNMKPPQVIRWDLIGVIGSRLFGRLMDIHIPTFLRNPIYNSGCKMLKINKEEIELEFEEYQSISKLFTRALKPNSRPVDTSNLVSPVDAKVVSVGEVIGDSLESVKGVNYSLNQFLGTTLEPSKGNKLFQIVLYLGPGNYHRIHSPANIKVKHARHFPGTLFPISPVVVRFIPNLFSLNERVVLPCEWEHGLFYMTPVGAYNVGSIVFNFEESIKTNIVERDIRNPNLQFLSYGGVGCFAYTHDFDSVKLKKGEEVGRFNLGSTVVLVFEGPKEFKFSVKRGDSVLVEVDYKVEELEEEFETHTKCFCCTYFTQLISNTLMDAYYSTFKAQNITIPDFSEEEIYSFGQTFQTDTEKLKIQKNNDFDLSIEEQKENSHHKDFIDYFSKIIWLTYRKEFPAIGDTAYTCDGGWGCLLRTGQMILAQALLRFVSGTNIFDPKEEIDEELYKKVIRWFDESDPENPYAIQKIAVLGLRFGKKIGTWFGPSTIVNVLHSLVRDHKELNLTVYAPNDSVVYIDQIDKIFKDNDENISILLLIHVRLGLDVLNPLYKNCVKSLFTIPQNIGIIGGRPESSLYFVATQDDNLFYLDPHVIRPSVNTKEDFSLEQYSTIPKMMKIESMDPSFAVGFFCKDRNDFNDFCNRMKEIKDEDYPVFCVENVTPVYEETQIVEGEDDFLII